MTLPPSEKNLGLIAEHPPLNSVRAGTANLVRTITSSPAHPFCAAVGADLAGHNPIRGTWADIPSLALFRPRSLFPHFRIGLGLLDNPSFRLQNRRVCRFLEEHRAEQLFILAANNPRFARFAADLRCSKPRKVYIIDDFVADSGLYRFNRFKARETLKRLVMESERLFTISPVYADDLEREFGRTGEFLPLPVTDELIAAGVSALSDGETRTSAKGDVILHHTGRIHHLYADALLKLIGYLREIASLRRQNIVLEFWGFGTKDIQKTLEKNCKKISRDSYFSIKFYGETSLQVLTQQQKRADLLVLANSFLPEMEKQVRCSFSSKIGEYLVSGTPILVYAPPYSSVAVHLSNNSAAHVLSSRDKDTCLSRLEAILDNPGTGGIAESARNLALREHSLHTFFEKVTR